MSANDKPIVSVTGILAVTPIVGYTVTFAHEMGYCLYFRIPFAFIRPDLTTIAAASVAVFLAIYIIIFFGGLFTWFSRDIKFKQAFLFYFLTFTFAACLTAADTSSAGWITFLITAAKLVIAATVAYAFILFSPPTARQTIIVPGAKQPAGPSQALNCLHACVPWLCAVLLIAFTTGRRSAAFQEYFFVPSIAPDTVVLRIYGDSLVCGSLDNVPMRLKPNITLIKVGTNPMLNLERRRIGRLKSSQ